MSHPFSPTSLTATKKGAFSLKFNHICLFNGITGPRAKNAQSPPRCRVAVVASQLTAASRRRRGRPDTVTKLLEALATTARALESNRDGADLELRRINVLETDKRTSLSRSV